MKILREILSPLIAVVAAFIVGGLVVALIGDNPLTTYSLLIGNSFGSLNDVGYMLFTATESPVKISGVAMKSM